MALAALLFAFGYLAGGELIAQAELLGGRVADVQKAITERLPPFLLDLLPKGDAGSGKLGDYATRFGTARIP